MGYWQTSRFRIDLSRPQVMGIVNLTPDSFSGDGQLGSPGGHAAALAHCEQLLREGADMLDIGAESSRPGAPPVSLAQELERLLPVLREAVRLGVPISVDTYKAAVMQAALGLGVDIINDIWALRQPGAFEVVSRHDSCGVCLMHMHKTPQDMHLEHMQGNAVAQVRDFLLQATQPLLDAGVARSRIAWDYGIGFGKSVVQNFALLAHQRELLGLDFPLLAGWSRKGSLGQVSGLAQGQRMVPSVAAALLAVERGARVVRVHDVADTVAALTVWQTMHDNN